MAAKVPFKIITLGNLGVGKSCIVLRFADGKYTDNFISTIGVDFKNKEIQVHEKRVTLQLWDTPGQERFRTITSSYYRGANGVVFVFDLITEDSFIALDEWLRILDSFGPEQASRIVLGNKCDLHDKRVITQQRAEEYCQKRGLNYFETSAKDDINIDEAFCWLANDILEKRKPVKEDLEYDLQVFQNPEPDRPSTKNCSCVLL